MSSGFSLPVRYLRGGAGVNNGGMGGGAAGGDPSRFSILGEPLADDSEAPSLGLSVAAVIAAAAQNTCAVSAQHVESNDDAGGHFQAQLSNNFANKHPFQLPVRRAHDASSKDDTSRSWESVP